MMSHYLKSRLPEFIACVMMVCGICFPIYAGFVLTDPFSNAAPLGMAVIAVICAVIYLLAYRRLTVIVGVIAAVALAAFAIIYIQVFDPLGDEEENSVFIFFLITVIICILVFLLTRTRAGTVAAALIGNLIFAGSKFLDFPVKLWPYFVLVIGSILMFTLRVYSIKLKKAETGKVRTGRYFIQSIIIGALTIAVAAGLFFAVIRPLNPPVYDLQLISLLRNMDIMEVFGTASEREVYDPDLASGQIRNGSEFADDEEDDDDGESDEPEDQDTTAVWYENSAFIKNLRAVTYRLKEHSLAFLIAIPVIIIAGIFIGRIVRKRIWRNKVRALSREDGVRNYYHFFMTRLERTGMKRPAEYTLAQYSDMMEHRLEPFTEGESSFGRLTDIYSRVNYGKCSVTEEEYDLFESFYDRFHKNLRQEIGLPKYLLKLFRI